MSWERSASQESMQRKSNPQASTSIIPTARAWEVAEVWSVSPSAREKPSIRFPKLMGSVNGRFSPPRKACRRKTRSLRTSPAALLPKWKAKASSRSAAVRALQGTRCMKTAKCQPLKFTPWPSVRTGRMSKGSASVRPLPFHWDYPFCWGLKLML